MGLDAAGAIDWTQARAGGRPARLYHGIVDESGDKHSPRDAVFFRPRLEVRRHVLRARQLQRRRQPRRALEGGSGGIDEDEFIDDIPFPETQNYVKRILGTAEDYRRLYPDGSTIPHTMSTLTPAKATVAKKPASKKKTPAKKTTPTTKKKTPAKPSTSSATKK